MSLNNYRDEAGDFLKKIRAEDEGIDIKINMLQEELISLKKTINNKEKLRHQVYDMLFLLFEIASDFDLDIDTEWNKGRKRKQKKYINQ